MTKKRPEKVFILDMKKAVESVSEFTKNLSQSQFEKNPMCESAVLYQLAILGDAAKQVSTEFRSRHPAIQWKKIAGLRDILMHAYHGLDIAIIWKIITVDLPPLLTHLEEVVKIEEI